MRHKKNLHSRLTRRDILKYGLYGSLSAGLSGSLWLSGCAKRQREKKPNIIFISIDTTRRDRCSVYGYERDTTPNLRLFAEQGATLDLAYAPAPTTGPSHATMFTSLYIIAHGVWKNGLKLSPGCNTIAEHLSTHGYQTAAIVGSFVLDSKFGYAQGFSFYDDNFDITKATNRLRYWRGHRVDKGFDRRADDTTQRAISWLKKQLVPERPFFLFVHYFDPHMTYDPPEPFLSQFAPTKNLPTELEKRFGKYDGEIAFADHEIGKLLETLKQMGVEEDTLVVITGDHGEGLMEHGHIGHAVNIYEEAVRIPLLFRWPNHIPQGRVLSAPVELVDLAPTILDLVGIRPNGVLFQGQSLAAALCGKTTLDKNRPVFLHRRHYKEGSRVGRTEVRGEKFGIRAGTWKYIDGRGKNPNELFDLSADPKELTNLYATFPKKAAKLAYQLEEWKRLHARAYPVRDKISEEDLQRLKSLGYIE
jgi:arylsulfatase A-like enzyme